MNVTKYHWFNMRNRGLAFEVKCGNTIVIPKGTKWVKIAFNQSHLLRYDDKRERWVPMNVYLTKDGKMYHA